MARPTKQNTIRVKKLEEAFSLGCSIEEACLYADITKQTYYNWIDRNQRLLDRFELLKYTLVLKARQTIAKAITEDPRVAFKYLERRKKDEFGTDDKLEENSRPIRLVIGGKDISNSIE